MIGMIGDKRPGFFAGWGKPQPPIEQTGNRALVQSARTGAGFMANIMAARTGQVGLAEGGYHTYLVMPGMSPEGLDYRMLGGVRRGRRKGLQYGLQWPIRQRTDFQRLTELASDPETWEKMGQWAESEYERLIGARRPTAAMRLLERYDALRRWRINMLGGLSEAGGGE